MRYIIAAATASALIVGIAIGFALTATVFEVEAKPPPPLQPVEEQNVDGSGFIAVHEQGVADVNVVAMPPQDLGPFEFMNLNARICGPNETVVCINGDPPRLDLYVELEALSAQGWSLIEITDHQITGSGVGHLIYTLSRPVP